MEWLVGSGLVIALGGFVAYQMQNSFRFTRWMNDIKLSKALFYAGGMGYFQYQLTTPNQPRARWKKCWCVITHKRIELYNFPDVEPFFVIEQDTLRGFWQMYVFTGGFNVRSELWIHAQDDIKWHILKLRFNRSAMLRCIRVMQHFATEEQAKAHRRRPPHVHRGASAAYPATQNLQGAWELGAQLDLYLMPLYLVVLDNQQVIETLALDNIQSITAIERLEGGKPDGLLRFTYRDDVYAFAIDAYEAWANDLAEAAKRTLEDPVMQKRKGKDASS